MNGVALQPWLVRTDLNHAQRWDQLWGYETTLNPFGIAVLPYGGYVLAFTDTGSEPASAVRLLFADSLGHAQWSRLYWSSGGVRSLAVTPDGGLALAGQCAQDSTGSDVLLIRTAPLPAVVSPAARAAVFSGIICHPNPFNFSTTLSFSLARTTRVRVELFDVLGRSVCLLTDAVLPAGEHDVAVNGTSLPSGLYFARLQSGSMQATHKLLLMK